MTNPHPIIEPPTAPIKDSHAPCSLRLIPPKQGEDHPIPPLHSGLVERRQITLTALGIMVLTAIAVGMVAILTLYQTMLSRAETNLLTLLHAQINLIESVAEFDRVYSQHDHPEGGAGATTEQLLNSMKRGLTFGQTGEFVIGRMGEKKEIIFLTASQDHLGFIEPIPLNHPGGLAEPMRRALLGHSATIIGKDYLNNQVLAAYGPIPSLHLGMVAKIHMSEVRQPFIQAAWITGLIALFPILVGALIILRKTTPLVARLIDRENKFHTYANQLKEETNHNILFSNLLKIIVKIADEAEDTNQVYNMALKEICEVTQWPIGHVYLRSSLTPECLEPSDYWYFRGADTEQIQEFHTITMSMSFRKGIGLPGRVLNSGRAVWIENMATETNFPRKTAAQNCEIRGGLGIPILANLEIMAVLELYSPELVKSDESLANLLTYTGFLLGRIIERKEVEQERDRLQQELITVSRLAGMADIASGVLHNIGNVLNSTSVSTSVVRQQLNDLDVDSFIKVVELLSAHHEDLAQYLTDDPIGQKIPDFLTELAQQWAHDQGTIAEEMETIRKNVEHIGMVIQAQQQHAKGESIVEHFLLDDILNEALKLAIFSYREGTIEIERHFEHNCVIQSDRHKVLQILLNLLHNARHALRDSKRSDPKLKLTLSRCKTRNILLAIEDNGVGISPENAHRIFENGFTTKSDGNGFGLHTAVVIAQELGGSLTVSSGGIGQGATFFLTLPIKHVSLNPESTVESKVEGVTA